MDVQQKKRDNSKMEIVFSNGNCAQLVTLAVDTPAASILKKLKIGQPKVLIMIAGGAAGLDKALKSRLVELFSKGIAVAIADIDVLIIDGGTHVGIMAIIGECVAKIGRNCILLGVAPVGKVTYPGGPTDGSIEDGAPLDPNHSHFVLVESNEWGGETETMYQLAEELSKEIPVLTVLVNGGQVAKHEVLKSVRHGWPIVVIEGTGRLADEIAIAVRKKMETSSEEIATIVSHEGITLFNIKEGPEALAVLIRQKLFQEPKV